MNTEQERADFEAAMDGLLFDRADDGTYTSSVTRVALEAYEAGRAALQSQDREDVKEVIERLPRYNFGYVSDEWGMGRQLGAIRHDNGRFLRIDDVTVAIDHARRIEDQP